MIFMLAVYLIYRHDSFLLYKLTNFLVGIDFNSSYFPFASSCWSLVVELFRNVVAHGDAREGKWRGNWRMEWVASTLTPLPNVVYPALFKLMRKPRLPAVDWTDAPSDLNGLVRFGEIGNLVSARVPSRSARAIRLGSGQGFLDVKG